MNTALNWLEELFVCLIFYHTTSSQTALHNNVDGGVWNVQKCECVMISTTIYIHDTGERVEPA